MVVEVVEGTSDVDQMIAGEGAEVGAGPSAGPARAGPAEDRLAEALLRVIRTNGKVQSAIMDLVLSSPYIQWEL